MLDLLPRRAPCGCRCVIETKEAIPVEHDHREDGSELDDDREGTHESGVLHTQEVLGDEHMACRRHGEELGEALYDRDDNSL